MFHMIWWSNMTIHHHPWDESRGVSKKRWWSCKRLNRSKPHTCLNHQVSELLQIWKILQVGNIGSNLGLFLVESFRGILCGGITWDAKAFGLSKGNISWDFLGSCYHFDSRNRPGIFRTGRYLIPIMCANWQILFVSPFTVEPLKPLSPFQASVNSSPRMKVRKPSPIFQSLGNDATMIVVCLFFAEIIKLVQLQKIVAT